LSTGTRALELLTTVLADAPIPPALDALAVRRCLIVLTATGNRHPQARASLFHILTRRPELIKQATAAVLQEAVEHAPDELAAVINSALPRFSTDLLHPACDLARRLLDALGPQAPPPQHAHRLYWLGIRLSDVGDKRAALATTREAVNVYRQLAETEPATHLPDLAGTVHNLGIRLSGVGGGRAALEPTREAVNVYRRLAEAEPAAHLPGLATALNNLGTCLAEVGDLRTALEPTQEAVNTYRRLAEAEPAAYLPDLASAFNNL